MEMDAQMEIMIRRYISSDLRFYTVKDVKELMC